MTRAERLLAIARGLVRELRPQAAVTATLDLDDSLERRYGLDSLARVELVTRLEAEFGVKLAESAFAEAETPRDLLRLIEAADSSGTPENPPSPPWSKGGESDSADIAPPPESLATLNEALDWHAAQHGERISITLYGEHGQREAISYRRLRDEALQLAAGLVERGHGGGQRIAIMLPTGGEFFAAFYGALYAGCVPVPLYPPARPSQIEDHLRRIAGVVANAGAVMLITIARAKPLARLLRAQGDSLQAVVTAADLAAGRQPAAPTATPRADDIAFLQYTSGSTGNPKGVVLSHANLLANLRAMMRATEVSPQDVFVSWLPLYHDMGLIGAGLGSMFGGFHLVLLSPLAFLARPACWLQAIAEHRASVSAAPNFAYELCAGKLAAAESDGLDLACWRLAFNGAEPVAAGTLERFAARFAANGFRREALTPVYGLAESSVGLAFPPLGRGPRIDRIDRRTLIDAQRAAPSSAADALSIVACGLPLPGHEIRIADAGGRELGERRQGRVQFRGPSSTSGYYGNPEASARLIENGWLNTGDLGYLADGELFITGRDKDIIIRGGHNIHPHELEAAAGDVAGVRRGGVAVFPASDPRGASERLVVVAETDVGDPVERQRIVAAIGNLAVELTGGPADDIVLAPPRTIRKTSSGKIRRAACRELYERGELDRGTQAPWRQLANLGVAAAGAQARRLWHSAGEWLWAGRAWAAFIAVALATIPLLLTQPGLGRRRRVARGAARLALRLAGLTPQVEGAAASTPAVYVANHASYLDAFVLVAVLPPDLACVGKQELAALPLAGRLLQRVGVAFVERFDAARGVEDSRQIAARARTGESLLFFPEGTFTRSPGLREFRHGAFVVAADSGLPVVPVAIRGTRSALRDGQWRPRREPLAVSIGEALTASGSDWAAAQELRRRARAWLLERTGEPDVAP